MNWREHLGPEIDRLAAVADGAAPTTPVPTCEGWTLADLLEHVGTIYRWAATMVRDRSQERLPREAMDWGTPTSSDGWPAWIRAGKAFVLETFEASDPSVLMWTWGWPKAASFWPRRMVHEVGVHRADAELALGMAPRFDDEVAADGVGELLDNLPHAAYFAPRVAELRGDGEVLALAAPGAAWRIVLRPDRFEWSVADADGADATVRAPTADGADATVRAPTAGDLLLALYGRPATVTVAGDRSLWQRWQANAAI